MQLISQWAYKRSRGLQPIWHENTKVKNNLYTWTAAYWDFWSPVLMTLAPAVEVREKHKWLTESHSHRSREKERKWREKGRWKRRDGRKQGERRDGGGEEGIWKGERGQSTLRTKWKEENFQRSGWGHRVGSKGTIWLPCLWPLPAAHSTSLLFPHPQLPPPLPQELG